MMGKDKDYRYMATSDLFNELNRDGFKPDNDLEAKLINILLQQLEDAAGDVSGLAVKWFVAILTSLFMNKFTYLPLFLAPHLYDLSFLFSRSLSL